MIIFFRRQRRNVIGPAIGAKRPAIKMPPISVTIIFPITTQKPPKYHMPFKMRPIKLSRYQYKLNG